MRHKDTAALREFLKGYQETDEQDVHPTDQEEKVPMPLPTLSRGGEEVRLPERDLSPLTVLLENRCSRRKYDGSPLTREELSAVLWAAQGMHAGNRYGYLRTAPSAGARQPLELYAFVNDVAGLAPGLYHYMTAGHKLERLGCRANQGDQLGYALGGQYFAGNAPVCLVWTAVPYRTEWRYDNKAHKYILLDAGHSCQNVYLACEELKLGCCAIGAYDQEALDELLGLPSGRTDDPAAEFAVYACCVGRPE